MPRPRHDSEVLPAKERLENAFWELLADRDYRKITVTDVVREAGVNRNSFYYHFSSLPELADSSHPASGRIDSDQPHPRPKWQSRGTMARPRHRHALRSRATATPRPPGPVGRPAQHA